MSALLYLASDIPFPEVKNPHHQTMSIQEALAREIEVPEFLLQDEKTDQNDPAMLLFTDSFQIDTENGIWEDRAYDDDFSICPMEKSADILTQKEYCASVQWNRYTKGRAMRIIRYIREMLTHTPQVEIWNIWMGCSYPPPKIRKVKISVEELDADALERLVAFEIWKTKRVTRPEIPREWGVQEDELEVCEQYCYEIVRKATNL